MKVFRYMDLTAKELAALDRDRTVVFSSVSPLEVHGDHLPLGTDLFIAESVRDRIMERLAQRHPDYSALVLPTLWLGANAIPVPGSVPVSHRAVRRAVWDTGRALADLGFRTWVLTDNHGGPLHQIALETAARSLAPLNLHLVAPFHALFRRMVDRDPALLRATGLARDRCGAAEDAHAGTNETSLMLALHPDKVRPSWTDTGPARQSPMPPSLRLLAGAARLLAAAGLDDAATDLGFLARALAWVGDPQMAPYQGDPSAASRQAGESMFAYHADLGMELLEEALTGTCPRPKPIGWSLRVLRFFL